MARFLFVLQAFVTTSSSLEVKLFVLGDVSGHDCGMDRDMVNRICAKLPGAEASDPWGGGHDAWKIGGKMFACIGAVMPGVSVKCPDIETAELLIETGRAKKAPYFHRSWVLIQDEHGLDEAELTHRLHVAYGEIRKKLTKKFQATLDPWPPE